MRLIDADALLEAYPECRGLKSKIETFPEYKPERKAKKWEFVSYGCSENVNAEISVGTCYCPECGFTARMYEAFQFSYCPKCGNFTGGLLE